MEKKMKGILDNVSKYYTAKLNEFGTTPKGVDWNSEESQHLRFEQLLKVIPEKNTKGSLLDFGCGYGSLSLYATTRFPEIKNIGYDISEEMINAAEEQKIDSLWISDREKLTQYNFVVASGIFNVMLNHDLDSWQDYCKDQLDQLNSLSLNGFSFNMLTKYSDSHLMREDLYYADPSYYFDYCKRHFSRNVALLHDYELYEFTIIVRK